MEPNDGELLKLSSSDVYVHRSLHSMHCAWCFRRMYVEEDGPSTKKLFIHVAEEHEGSYTCSGMLEGNLQSKTFRLELYSKLTLECM